MTGDIERCLISPNVGDSNWEPANVVDVLDGVRGSLRLLADAITPTDAAPGHDATGGTVASLTEAVMGITAGLLAIAAAIERLAEAVDKPGKP